MADQQESDAPMSVLDEPLHDPAVPTARELDLLRQLALKQQEVDDLASTLTLLTQNPTARPPPLPLPPPSTSAAMAELLSLGPSHELVIPRTLVPVLAHLREHGLALAAENRELRLLVTSSDVEGTSASESGASESGASASAAHASGKKARKVDLAKVVERMRVLTEENRELGLVIEELGREVGESRGLKAALNEAHETIYTLDSDLEGSFGQIEALRAILDSYEKTLGRLSPATTTYQL